jgi:hypothetical protein
VKTYLRGWDTHRGFMEAYPGVMKFNLESKWLSLKA